MPNVHGSSKIKRMSSSPARDQLVATLEEILLLQRQLVADARDTRVPATELVTQVSVLERLDDRRDELIARLRRETSADRRTGRRGPPLRQIVVDALTEFRWPQNAKFLEEYLWATSQLQLDSPRSPRCAEMSSVHGSGLPGPVTHT